MNEPFVPIEDLANHFSVSVSTIRSWVRQGHIPKDTYIKVGNTYRFSVTRVASALLEGADDFDVTVIDTAPTDEDLAAAIEEPQQLSLDDDF